MSKSVKLELSVYDRLEKFRGKKETFSAAVDRLLTLMEKMGELRNVIEGGINLRKQQERKEGE